jgi:flagellar biosynthesis protein FliQ
MTSLTVNKRSWHYAIAKFGGMSCAHGLDLCTYTRKFILGLFRAALSGALIALLGYVLFSILFGIGFSIFYGVWMFDEVAISGLIMLFAIAAFILTCTLLNKIDDYNSTKAASDNFIKHAYSGWKNKFCVKIDITD